MQQILPGRQSRLDSSESADLTRPVVLDTNVILDLLVFADPCCEELGLSLACHPLRWHATQAMRDEFEAVLARPKFARFTAQRGWAMNGWHGWARMVEPLVSASPRLTRAVPVVRTSVRSVMVVRLPGDPVGAACRVPPHFSTCVSLRGAGVGYSAANTRGVFLCAGLG